MVQNPRLPHPTPTVNVPLDIYDQLQDNLPKRWPQAQAGAREPELGCSLLVSLQGALSWRLWDIEVSPFSFPPSLSLPY